MIKTYAESVTLCSRSANQLIFNVSKDLEANYYDFFEDFDRLEIDSYDIRSASLEEVFLNVNQNKAIQHA